MLMPATIPKNLQGLAKNTNPAQLLEALISQPNNLLLFFESACDDQTWCEQFPDFLHELMKWLTANFAKGQLSLDVAKRIATIIHEHSSILNSLIPNDIVFIVQRKKVPVNSLLYSASSDFFYALIKRHLDENINKKIQVKLPGISYQGFRRIDEFVNEGQVNSLWREESDFLFKMLQEALSVGLFVLGKLCEVSLIRYISKDNVFEILFESHAKGWYILEKECLRFITKLHHDVVVALEENGQVSMEFLEFSENSMEVFYRIKNLINLIICRGVLSEHLLFGEVLKNCPHLKTVDIAETRNFSEQLYHIPVQITELNLSTCEWLSDELLPVMISICPGINKLKLSSNVQLTYKGWIELQELKNLIDLDISRCVQITDQDFSLIIESCPLLKELNLDYCKKLGEHAFLELSKKLTQLSEISFRGCHISDTALLEIASHCPFLSVLNIAQCLEITERGIMQLVQQARSLRILNISKCKVSEEFLEIIRKKRPEINIEA